MKFSFFAILMCFFLSFSSAYSFEAYGIDFGIIWDKVINFFQDEEEIVEVVPNKVKVVSTSSKPKVEKSVVIAGTKYNHTYFKQVFSNEGVKDKLKSFAYECIYVETDKGVKFTLFFDSNNFNYKSVKYSKDCDTEVFLEEDLIKDINQNGFDSSNIKGYLDKVELPMSMYFKAVKVFTVG